MWRFFMSKLLLVLAMIPLFSSASDDMSLAASVRGLPDDFRRYFYESEIVVRVYLNDTPLFDAAISLKNNGKLRLLWTINESQDIDQDVRVLWSGILQQGVALGKCTAFCPSGLMNVEYRLDSSVLKLYTSQYETDQVRSAFISIPADVPGGLIMYNDVSATGTSSAHSWGINSSLISSFAGWSQRASFQSSGTDGRYHYSNSSLYELFSQKELPGSFIRIGLFSPDSDTSNVQTSGFGYDTVAGAMWGTSDALLLSADSVSAWPVYVTGRNQSIAEVWRDGRLIYTQQLQSGVQALDTRQLPSGIYDVIIKIIENGQNLDTQRAQIYKPQGWNNPDSRWRMNLWAGQHRMLATGNRRIRENNPFALGGALDVLAKPWIILGFSGAMSGEEYQARTRANITLSPNDTLFAQYSLGSRAHQSNQSTDIRYYRNILSGGSASLFWNSISTDVYGHKTAFRQTGNTWGGSLSLRLSWFTSVILNGQYIDTAWRRGLATEASVTALTTLSGCDVNFRLNSYDRPGFNNHRRDRGISFGVIVSRMLEKNHTVSGEAGMNRNDGYANLNYQWEGGEDSRIRSLGSSVSYSKNNLVISGNGAADTPYLSGDFYAQHNVHCNTNTAGGNMSQVLVVGGGKVASVNGNHSRSMESAVIVDVDSDDKDARIFASGNIIESRLLPGRNIVPVEIWKKNQIHFTTQGGESVQISPERQSMQMNRGSVQYVKVKALKTFTLVGMLLDERGQVLKNRYVKSGISSGMINADGVLTLDSAIANRMLTVRAEDGQRALQCPLPSSMDQNKRVQFISAVRCQAVSTGEN